MALMLAVTMSGEPAMARSPSAVAKTGIDAFTRNCFSPRMTAKKAAEVFEASDISYDFYDLDPLTSAAPSPAQTSATPGTDRRCEVTFAGDFSDDAMIAVLSRLSREKITEPAEVPATHSQTSGTTLLAARRLNPSKIAVVHIGTRQGPNGLETFLNVERLRSPK
ncbi:MAG: succinyl-CoA synthetase subunit beta [Pseudomonadota bacterium]